MSLHYYLWNSPLPNPLMVEGRPTRPSNGSLFLFFNGWEHFFWKGWLEDLLRLPWEIQSLLAPFFLGSAKRYSKKVSYNLIQQHQEMNQFQFLLILNRRDPVKSAVGAPPLESADKELGVCDTAFNEEFMKSPYALSRRDSLAYQTLHS